MCRRSAYAYKMVTDDEDVDAGVVDLDLLRRNRDDMVFTRWLFVRCLAVVSFVAFLSFYLQFPGLIGEEGVLPLADYLSRMGEAGLSFLNLPTLSWFLPSETGVALLSFGGMLLSILLFFGVAPPLVLFLLWLFYLSLTVDGRIFTSYQWDMLLLETLFVSILLAPHNALPRLRRNVEVESPSWLSVLLLRLVLFKLVFLSGLGKVAGSAWTDLTAMTYHYWTQPLPTPLAWYAAKLPPSVHGLTTLLVLVVEILVPVLIFAPRRYRIGAAYVLAGFQVIIMLTGNYAFFNVLTIVLCVLLLDDRHLRWLRERIPRRSVPQPSGDRSLFDDVVVLLVVFLMIVNAFVLVDFFVPTTSPEPVDTTVKTASTFGVANSYGLFTKMTQSRHELVVQGSVDGETWKTYGFRYKPDEPDEPPPVVAPHQPRLDWQMWFASIDDGNERWLRRLLSRLLRDSDDVERLFAHDPFEDTDEGPRFARVLRYEYRFTTHEQRSRTGRWWNRSEPTVYMGPVSVEDPS